MKQLNQKLLDMILGDISEAQRLAVYRRLALAVVYVGVLALVVGGASWIMGWEMGKYGTLIFIGILYLIHPMGAKQFAKQFNDLSNELVSAGQAQHLDADEVAHTLRALKWKALAMAVGLSAVLMGVVFPRDTPWFWYAIFGVILSVVIG